MQRPRLASFVWLPVGIVLAACGGRSALSPAGGDAAEGGAGATMSGGAAGTMSGGAGGTSSGGAGGTSSGGAGGTSSVGAAGSGGDGGSVTVACSSLAPDGAPLSPVPAGNTTYQYFPSLVAIEPDVSLVGLVYHEPPVPFSQVYNVASVGLKEPWGPWPDSIGNSVYHVDTDSFVIGAGANARFSLLATAIPGGPQGLIVGSPEAGIPGNELTLFNKPPPGYPLFVLSNGKDYLTGFQAALADGLYHLFVGRAPIDGESDFSFGAPIACSLDATISGSVIPAGDNFLGVFSNGRPFKSCLTDDLPDALPSRLQVAMMKEDPSKAELIFEADEPGTFIFQTKITRSKGGTWAAWERIGLEPPIPRRIQLMKLDDSGAPVSGKIIEVGFGIVGFPIAIAALGPNVALATASGSGALEIYLLAEDGSLLFKVEIEPEAGFQVASSVTALGSPAGDQLLVAWDEDSAINNDNHRSRVVRLSCVQ